ncbi:hypothetical protein PR202_ga22906 [Eleusine coracana subsp. coracana]|uniref:Auxilin-related protein 2 n=1 Tax=Eleusine coracana subsp. coracana TaxID=191504 RepID=A0AAV5D551_ELECO|nr:hypothetical protein PR202_ga22906 [Eleusine coracana subsp. coracana]
MDDPVLVDEFRPSKPPPASVYDDMFESYFNSAAEPPEPSPKASSSSSSTPPPVFDKPVFDDDPDTVDPFDAIPLFGGGGDVGEDFLGGLGSAEKSEERMEPKALRFDDDLFPGHGGSARSRVREAADQEAVGFDDLIPGFGGSVKPAPPMEPEEVVFADGVIPGFGGSTNRHNSARDDPVTRKEREPMSSSKMSVSMPEDSFVILGATPKSEYSSFGLFSDYSDSVGMPVKSENTKVNAPANTSGRFQGSDMFAGFPNARPAFSFASEKESDTTGRRSVDSLNSMSHSNHMLHGKPPQQGSTEATADILPEMNIAEPSIIHEVPIVTGFQTLNPFAMDDGLPETKYSKMADDVWLTVSDITLVTQPTSAPPPSRSPPPLVTKHLPTESVATKTYPHHHNQGNHHFVGLADTLKSSQIDDLEDLFTAKPAKFANGHRRVLSHDGTEQYSSTVTVNFMGQSDLRDSKGMKQGDFGSVFSDQEMEKMDQEARLKNERRQREHDEEQRRAERERIEELEREREKVRQWEQEEQKRREKERDTRQAVEKAIREARERAAVEARVRAENEARRRAERAAVQKATAEARDRAALEARDRAAKAAAEAKERAAAEARDREAADARERAAAKSRERAATVAAEAREKAAAESQEKAAAEARAKAERAAVEKATAEARRRAERAAYERATVEARERAAKAAVEAKERAAAGTRERAAAESRERAARAAAEAREKAAAESQEKAAAEAQTKAERAAVEKATAEAQRRAERAAFERVAAEARQRAANEARERAAAEARARENQQRTATTQPDLESFFGTPSRSSSVPRSQTATTNPFDVHPQGTSGSGTVRMSSDRASPFMQPSSSNLMDDLSSIFGGPSSSAVFQELDGESVERRKARLERHQRTMERAAKSLAEKNERDLQAQREQEERHVSSIIYDCASELLAISVTYEVM